MVNPIFAGEFEGLSEAGRKSFCNTPLQSSGPSRIAILETPSRCRWVALRLEPDGVGVPPPGRTSARRGRGQRPRYIGGEGSGRARLGAPKTRGLPVARVSPRRTGLIGSRPLKIEILGKSGWQGMSSEADSFVGLDRPAAAQRADLAVHRRCHGRRPTDKPPGALPPESRAAGNSLRSCFSAQWRT